MFWLGKSIEVKGIEIPESDKKRKSLNLSPLEVLIMAQLRSREIRNEGAPLGQYGYEMMSDLNELFAGSWEAKSGTIYPMLSKLENKKKLIYGRRQKSPLGPVKTVYKLTEWGRKAIDLLIKQNISGDLDFILNFLDLIAPFTEIIDEDQEDEEIFEKMTTVPSRVATLNLTTTKTRVDLGLRRKKLGALLKNFQLAIETITEELDTLEKVSEDSERL